MNKVLVFLAILAAGFLAAVRPLFDRGTTVTLASLPPAPLEHTLRFMADDFSVLFLGLVPWRNPERTITIAAAPDFPFDGVLRVATNPVYLEHDLVAALGEDYAAADAAAAGALRIQDAVRPYPLLSIRPEEGGSRHGTARGTDPVRLRIVFDRAHVLQGQIHPGMTFATRLDVTLGDLSFPIWLRIRLPRHTLITILLPAAAGLVLLWALAVFLGARKQAKGLGGAPLAGDSLALAVPAEGADAAAGPMPPGRLQDFLQRPIGEHTPRFSLAIRNGELVLTGGGTASPARDGHPSHSPPVGLAVADGTVTVPWIFPHGGGKREETWKVRRFRPDRRQAVLSCAKVLIDAVPAPSREELVRRVTRARRSVILWTGVFLYALYLLFFTKMF